MRLIGMPSSRDRDWTYLLLCPYVAFAHIPWVALHVRMRFVLPGVLLWFILALLHKQEVFMPPKVKRALKMAVLFLLIYLLQGTLFALFGHGDWATRDDISDIVQTLIPLAILHLSVRKGQWRELGWLVLWFLACIGCTAVMTVRGEGMVENASRILTGQGGRDINMSDLYDAYFLGVGGYLHVYATGLLVAPLLYCARWMPAVPKVICLIVAAVAMVGVYSGAYSILILAVGVGVLLWALQRVGGRFLSVKVLGLVLAVGIALVIERPHTLSFMIQPLQTLRDMTSREQYHIKIDAIIDTIGGASQSYVTDRSELYMQSWRTFLKNSIVGTGMWQRGSQPERSIGGHSEVFDQLGRGGLIGFTLFILCLYHLLRYLHALGEAFFSRFWWPAVHLFLWPAALVALVNPLCGYIVYTDLLLIIPGMACLFTTVDSTRTRNWSPTPEHVSTAW